MEPKEGFPVSSKHLLHQLVQDTCATLPVDERKLENCKTPTLIYNLFNGKYIYSFTTFSEVFKMLQMRDFGIPVAPITQRATDRKKSSEITDSKFRVDTDNPLENIAPSKKKKKKTLPIPCSKVNFPLYNFRVGSTHETECFYCKERYGGCAALRKTRDHIYPQKLGGNGNEANIIFCCSKCNAEKDHHTIQEFLVLVREKLHTIKKNKTNMIDHLRYERIEATLVFMISKLYPDK